MKTLSNHLIYSSPTEYAAFPSVAIDSDGTLYCVFRLAPTRKSKTHIDTRSIAVLMKSGDEGETWEKVSEVKPTEYTGLQDPSLCILGDGTFLLNYFGYAAYEDKHTKKAKKVKMFGPFVIKSKDRGKTWIENRCIYTKPDLAVSEPIIEPWSLGNLYMAGYADTGGGGHACFLLRYSEIDQEWKRRGKIAHNLLGNLDFQEPALLGLEANHFLCLMRVPTPDGSVIYQAHSWDAGQTWEPPRKTGIEGLPPSLLQLRDGRILCTYGYRKTPHEIRACVSRNEGITWDTDDLMVIRTNGGGWDVGYPGTVQLPDGDLYTVYYWYDSEDKTRRIKGTRWKI